MRALLLVASGGALGAVARYLVGLLSARYLSASFPWATLTVNFAGCLLIGLCAPVLMQRSQLNLFLVTGVLGGFTTFSSFGYESFRLWEQQGPGLFLMNIAAHVVLGLVAVWFGLQWGKS